MTQEPDVPRSTEWANGHRVGRYIVLYRLGEGGMGRVYAAYDPHLDRKIALKVLRPSCETAEGPGAGERLLREAQTLARLSHAHVVAIHDVGLWEDAVFLAMDLVEGETLRGWWQRRPRRLREVVDVFTQAGRGLAAAHAAGVVHRDFKPENVLVDVDGRVRVLDFGLAEPYEDTLPDETEGPSRIRAHGPGTPAYMAPEQRRGGSVGPAADQFSFCVVLFEALYQRLPFEGSGESWVRGVIDARVREAARGRSVPVAIDRVLRRGLSPDPIDRYPSMTALLVDLRQGARARRHPLWTAGLLAGGLGAAAALGAVGLDQRREGCEAEDHRSAWTERERAAIQRAFASADRPRAEAAHAHLERSLTAYDARWRAFRDRACSWRPEVSARCVAHRKLAFTVLLAELGQGDATAVEQASAAARALPPWATCEQGPAPLVLDPGLERARAHLALGRPQEAASLARERRELPEGKRDPLLWAEASFVLGRALLDAGRPPAAAEALRDAAYAAEQHDHRELLADARIALLEVTGQHLHRTERARLWAALAKVALDRLGHDPQREAERQLHLAAVARRDQGPESALEHLRRAVALGDEHPVAPPLHRARYQRELALALGALGRHPDALEAAERSAALVGEALGPHDPAIAEAESTLGRVWADGGDVRRALHHHERALAHLDATVGPGSRRSAAVLDDIAGAAARLGDLRRAEDALQQVLELRFADSRPSLSDLATAHEKLGAVLTLRGRLEEALGHHRQALELREQHLGPDHAELAPTLTALADTLEQAEQVEESLESRWRAVTLLEGAYGPEAPALVVPLGRLAHGLLVSGRSDEALPLAERSLRLALGHGLRGSERAFARLVLARVLTDRGEAAARVRLLVHDARLETDDPPSPDAQRLLDQLAAL